jgi:hypothetical protein
VQKLLEQHLNVAAIVAIFVPKFAELLERESELVDSIKGSKFTAEIAKADERIDRNIVGINSIIDSGLHHYDPNVVNAAKVLEVRMKAFRGDIEKKAYEEESAAVKILVKDFRQIYAAEATILGLGGWIDELAAAQEEFERLFIKRNTELAARPQDRLKEIRRDIEAIYRQMIDRIAAYILLNDDGSCNVFIEELNRQITYFNEHSHRQKKQDIKDAVIENIPDQKYSGEPVVYLPTVFFNEKKLVFAKDYELLYKHNDKPGTATISIKGKGSFKGQTLVRFNITE